MRREDRSSIVVSSSRRPRRVRDVVGYVIDRLSSSSCLRCSFVRAWWPFLRPGLRVQARRAQGPSRLAVAQASPLASMLPGHALYEAFQVKRYFAAFFTFFIPSFFVRLGIPFLRPDPHVLEVDARRGCQGRPSLCSGLRSIVSRPSLDSPCARRHACCGRDDASEGSSLSGARSTRAATLYPVDRSDPNHDACMRIGGKLRGGGPHS
jgi:hypothetical protein